MTEELVPGLYEALLTEELSARIRRARGQGKVVELDDVDALTWPTFLPDTCTIGCSSRSPASPVAPRSARGSG